MSGTKTMIGRFRKKIAIFYICGTLIGTNILEIIMQIHMKGLKKYLCFYPTNLTYSHLSQGTYSNISMSKKFSKDLLTSMSQLNYLPRG